ncbi:hypothetical protein [Deinococcus sp. 6GRE01]|uniref:hypothetical protein n=1 Tax=Deinococcus sp. 6GRE01 TaxID=2745873 RepID=UPI001E2F02D5|nr:hypothetical protein [Deinococcus sp. 6GRE01]MCD0156097.1 hypothetical protein [Deinococcus sp. 6GRE01]
MILSTYHSAKGSEFDHMFILSEGLRHHGAHAPADDTRARHSVTLLRREGDCHPTLISRTFQETLQSLNSQPCPVPTDEPLPVHLHYRIDGDPADLYISAPELLSPEGRAATMSSPPSRSRNPWARNDRSGNGLPTIQGDHALLLDGRSSAVRQRCTTSFEIRNEKTSFRKEVSGFS